MKTPEELSKAILHAAKEWTLGALVWHRASAERGVVCGYVVDPFGEVMIEVDYAHKTAKEWPFSLSPSLITRDGDDEGEGWKGGCV